MMKNRIFLLAGLGAVAIGVIAITLILQSPESVDQRIYRINQDTGEGTPSDELLLRYLPQSGPWAVLGEPFAAGPSPDEFLVDTSYGRVEWTFEDGVIHGRVEVPARPLSLQFSLAVSTEGDTERFVLTARYDPPTDADFYTVSGFSADGQLKTDTGDRLTPGTEPFVAVLETSADPTTIRSLIETDEINVAFRYITYGLLTSVLVMFKGDDGRAVFQEAFAAWGLEL